MTLGGISSAHGHALAGLAAGTERMLGAAESLHQDVSVEGIVDLKSAKMQMKASTAVVRAVDENLGALLDDLA